MSRAILPVLSSIDGDDSLTTRIGLRWGYVLLIGGFIASMMVWYLSPYIVKYLLERGEFSSNDTAEVLKAVRFGLFQVPFYFSGVVLAQVFISLQKYKIILFSSFSALFLKVLFCFLLVPHFSYAGILLASLPVYLVNNMFFLFWLRRN